MVRRPTVRRRLAVVLFAAMASASSADSTLPPASYVVTFDAPPTAAQVETLFGVALGVHPYTHLPAASVMVMPEHVALLANLPGVRGVYPNRTLETVLDESTRTLRADGAWADGYTGAGIGIAVIDAGVDGSHPDLCARPEFCIGTPVKTVQNVKILGRQSVLDPVVVLEDQISTDSSSGHGTHVAGIAAGAGSASETPGRYLGVAPGASIIGLGTGEVLEVDTVLAGFDWVLANKDDPRYNIKVINNSWGPGAGHPYDPDEPVQRAIAAAHDAGLSVVFGAGNDGPRTGTLNAFSANPKAISAAAGTKAGHMAVFSSRGVPGSWLWRPTVTAPGMFIASVRARTGFYADVADATGPDPNDPILPPDDLSYAYASGTSMAAPHVAGVVALIQEAALENLQRYLTPDEVRNVLQNTAVSQDPARGPGGLPSYQGYQMGAGYADALAAVRAVAAGVGLHSYDAGVIEDARAFTGTIAASAIFVASSFETTYSVSPGALGLDVMADWADAAPQAAVQDIDIDLYDPNGVLRGSTFLRCAAEEGPNQYSSFCSALANERIVVTAPMAGTWRAVVKGTVAASETVHGMWSAVYPAGTLPPAGPVAASITLTGPATPPVAGQDATLTATVRDAGGQPVANAPVSWSSAGVGALAAAEGLTDERGTVVATARSNLPGAQNVTATSGAASGSVALSWLGLPAPPPAPPSTPGKASGGGHFTVGNKRHFAFFAEYTAQAGAPGGDLSYDDKAGAKVKGQSVESLAINGNQAVIKGSATYNGASGYRFEITTVDHGEPGSNDSFSLVVTQPLDPLFRYESGGTLSGGNVKVQAY